MWKVAISLIFKLSYKLNERNDHELHSKRRSFFVITTFLSITIIIFFLTKEKIKFSKTIRFRNLK